jgi:hypothetical protein
MPASTPSHGINLLEYAELGEVAEELKKALSSPQNSVRGY